MWWIPSATLLVGLASIVVVKISNKQNSKSSALERARALDAPIPKSSYAGEYEDHEWWDQHHQVLEAARQEYGQLYPELYDFAQFSRLGFIDPDLLAALPSKDPARLRALCHDTNAPNVYKVRIFTPLFVERFRKELEHHEASGIPRRRPNGMNRFGWVMDDLGFADAFSSFADTLLRPLAFLLYPDYVGPYDLDEQYNFVVNYKPGQDIQLAEHSDASTVTTNVCLLPSKGPSPLYFRGYQYDLQQSSNSSTEAEPSYVELNEPGMALLHLGGNRHAVSPVDSERSNLVVWMYGKHGYVRIAPYTLEEMNENQQQIYKRQGWDQQTIISPLA